MAVGTLPPCVPLFPPLFMCMPPVPMLPTGIPDLLLKLLLHGFAKAVAATRPTQEPQHAATAAAAQATDA